MDEDYKNTSYNSTLVQQALAAGNEAASQQRGAANSVVNNAEQGMYDMLGKMQLQNERGIADRRMQALRSGQTSSQLAALEMQNIQAGQIGAQQIMTDARDQRMQVEMQYAGKEATNRQFMFETMNQNQKDYAAIDAQKYSSGLIPQVQELFPNADALTQAALAKSFTFGQDVSKDDQALIDAYKKTLSPAEAKEIDNASSSGSGKLDIAQFSQQYAANIQGIIDGTQNKTEAVAKFQAQFQISSEDAEALYKQFTN